MLIKAIVIQGVDGEVEIAGTDAGALVTSGNKVLCEVRRDEAREDRYAKAYTVARAVYGADGGWRARATNSTVHDVLDAVERVAGC